MYDTRIAVINGLSLIYKTLINYSSTNAMNLCLFLVQNVTLNYSNSFFCYYFLRIQISDALGYRGEKSMFSL